jgi:hypothetical protein
MSNLNDLSELEVISIELPSNKSKLFELYEKIEFLKQELKSAKEINNLLGQINGRFKK